jgi:transposase
MKKEPSLKLDSETLNQLAPSQLVEIIIEQAKAIEQLKSRVVELEKKIQELKVSRDLDSTISSKPPSADLLKKTENYPVAQPSESQTPKRKPGGQPGHPGKTRKGFDRVDREEILRPQVCRCCGQQEFSSEPIKIETQQVAQLVDRPIEIVEYQKYTCICSQCGETQTADWSAEIVPGQDLGIRLQAFLGWLNNYGHLSYEKQQELLWELGKVEIGVGTLVATNERIDGAVNPSIDRLKEWLKQTQPNIHVDETPWLVKGLKEWLWIFANTDFALFHAADTRSRAELDAILGSSYSGVLSSDDYSAYNGYEFLSWTSGFKLKVETSIHSWMEQAGGEAGKLLRSLQKKSHQWWYFLDHPEIPPDNNLAERTLRLAVTKRKVSGGSRSMERFQDTANLLTVIQTCRRQRRSVIEFFDQAIKAMVNSAVQTPSLIPQVET